MCNLSGFPYTFLYAVCKQLMGEFKKVKYVFLSLYLRAQTLSFK